MRFRLLALVSGLGLVVAAPPLTDSSVDSILSSMDSEIKTLTDTIREIMLDHMNGPSLSGRKSVAELDVHAAAKLLLQKRVPRTLSHHSLDRIAEVQVEAQRVLYGWFNTVLNEKIELVENEIDFLIVAGINRGQVYLPPIADLWDRFKPLSKLTVRYTLASVGQDPSFFSLEKEFLGSKFLLILRPLIVMPSLTSQQQTKIYETLIDFIRSLDNSNEKDIQRVLSYVYTELQITHHRLTSCLKTEDTLEQCYQNAIRARDRMAQYHKSTLQL